jgi:two-component system, OmpR family, sensor histidine kinase KdpD
MARGRLRIYLGAAPGVGKTYAMLAEGHRRVAQGADCVIGFVEPHGRRATSALAAGLEAVPRRLVAYRGGQLPEMDLDAVLARRPQVALVDELAHTNAAGSRHAKRWQDITELLAAGIDVLSTLNIQHLESLNDAVADMTGVRQRETVPDAVVRAADEVELVDLSPEALRRRMTAGDIYPPDRIDAALSHYFRPGNLTGLRELALLWLADRVDEGLQRYRAQHGITAPWEARERIVVAVSGGPESERLIRRGARLASRTPASDLLAVYVARSDGRPGADAATLGSCRSLVESLGGGWHQIVGADVAGALAQFARYENATQLLVGSSRRGGLRSALTGREPVVRRITRISGPIDVHVVLDGAAAVRPPARLPQFGGLSLRRRLASATALLVLLPALTAVLVLLRDHLALSADLLAYLLVVVIVAVVGGVVPALVAALASAGLVDFFLTRPLHSLAVAWASDVVSLAVFVATALLVSWAVELAARRQRLAARASAEAAAVTSMAGVMLAGQGGLPRLLELVRETFGLDAVSLLERSAEVPPDANGWFMNVSSGDDPPELPAQATVTAELSPSLVLAARGRPLPPADLEIFNACAAQVTEMLLQRQLSAQAASAEQEAGGERRRSAMAAAAGRALSSPVTTAREALSSLRKLPSASEREEKTLIDELEHSVGRIGLLAQQLTDVTRARAGALDVHLSPVDVAEVVAAALAELGPGHGNLAVQIPDDLPDVIADGAVLAQVVVALAASALRRSRPGATPTVAAAVAADRVEITFVDGSAPAEPGRPAYRAGRGLEPGAAAPELSWRGAFTLGVAQDLTEAIGGSLRTAERADGQLAAVVSLPSARPRRAGSGSAA